MSRGMLSWLLRSLLCLLLSCMVLAAQAQTRAWIDRDNIAVGETTTLNIETDDLTVDSPDYSPLRRDFAISGNTSSRQIEIVNGETRTRMLYAVALQPKREGALTIPALRIGSRTTQPLALNVSAVRVARAGGPVFIEASADDPAPYVQQSVGYTVRLYYETPLISGQLDQPTPEGASLQRVGRDVQYTDQVGGKQYTVVERRYLLIPERSGALTVPGARFQGRGLGGFFDDMFGDGERELNTAGNPQRLSVRPIPANAPQPWLPLRGLSLRYLNTPQSVRAGEAATVMIEVHADGANAPQLPDLQLPSIDGAQVFADPVQSDDTIEKGRPQTRLTRKFSIVPAQAGTLRVPGPRIVWWDTSAGIARTASLPDLNLRVGGGTQGANSTVPRGSAAGATAISPAAGDTSIPGAEAHTRPWALATVIFAVLWLVTLGWGLHRRNVTIVPQRRAVANAGQGVATPSAPRIGQRDLKHLLDTADLGTVADALCMMTQPQVADLDALRARLDDPAQQAAVEQLQRARWGGGDAVAARAALRSAFASGPRWKTVTVARETVLPPLYPS
ncbi:BatD family protein [Luteimonas panaciterrae]|uniref:BatD family protein n=1 Tax=Luteimonas panaciterrae TaxID=363885 RepID=UPI001CFA0888|nr:BatD family protein [Luteimonas panaciterrae]